MTYCTDADVKYRLNITHSDFDTHITEKREQAYDWINTRFEPYVTVLPIVSPVQIIIDAEADIATGMFQEEKYEYMNEYGEKDSVLRKRGELAIEQYIDTEFEIGPLSSRVNMIRKIRSEDGWEA